MIPIFTGLYFISKREYKILNNSFNRLYLSLFLVILAFFFLQSILYLKLEWFSIKGVMRYLAYVVFAIYIFKLNIKVTEGYFKYISIILIALLPFTFFNIDQSGGYQGIFRHSNHLGYIIVIVIYFFVAHRPYNLFLTTIVLALLTVMLFLTKTTGAILILFLLVLYNFFISTRVKLKYKLLFLFGPFLLLIPLVVFFSEKIIEQIDSLEYLKWDFIMHRVNIFNPGGYGSFIWRIVYWLKIYLTFIDESLTTILFGLGIDSLTKGNMPYRFMYTDPHNDFLKIFVEFGAIGLTLFLSLLRNIFLILKKNINILIILFIPLMFDNAIVNFSFNLTMIILIAYEYKKIYSEGSN